MEMKLGSETWIYHIWRHREKFQEIGYSSYLALLYLHPQLGDTIGQWWRMKQLLHLFFRANSKYHTAPAKILKFSQLHCVPEIVSNHVSFNPSDMRTEAFAVFGKKGEFHNKLWISRTSWSWGCFGFVGFSFWRQLLSRPWWSKRLVWNGKSLEIFQKNCFFPFFFPGYFRIIPVFNGCYFARKKRSNSKTQGKNQSV